MHLEPRCSHCDSEDPKIISLRDPAGERYCGRFCLDKVRDSFAGYGRMRSWSRHDNVSKSECKAPSCGSRSC